MMNGILSRLRWIFSPRDKKMFLLLAVLMAFSALLEMAGLGMLVGAAALFLSPENPAAQQLNDISRNCLPGIPENWCIAAAISAVALLLIGKNIFAFAIIRLQIKFTTGIQQNLAERLFNVYLHARNEEFSKLAPAECINHISRVYNLCNQILMPAMQMLADILVVITVTLAALILFPGVTLLSTLFMAATAGTLSKLTKKANMRAGKNFLEAELKENKIRHIGIYGKKNINITNSETFFAGQFSKAYRTAAVLFGRLYALGQIPRLALESASILTAAGIFCILLLSGMPKSEIMMIFAVLTAAVARMLPALSRCHYNLILLRQYDTIVSSFTDCLQNIPQEELNASGETADASGEIVFDHITFAYRDGAKVFRDFSLTIAPGSVTAIAGKSGRGKTTLAELLLTLLKPQQGRITAGGVDIFNNPETWRRQTGYVPQDIFLPENSIRENVAFGVAPENIDDRKVIEALKIAQLDDFTPQTQVSAKTVSGGQRQRIGIARALYHDAKLLILDEPTSALDCETEEKFCQALKELHGKMTIIVISHRESTLQYCDRTVTI